MNTEEHYKEIDRLLTLFDDGQMPRMQAFLHSAIAVELRSLSRQVRHGGADNAHEEAAVYELHARVQDGLSKGLAMLPVGKNL